jgi:ABC-type bacteriocin/lantibiotic exporter with double-glycine peptidase domain
MELEKNPITRRLFRRLLQLDDKVGGLAFPKMKRTKQITNSHCGPAVLEELFSFLGMKVSQTSIVKTIRAQRKIMSLGLNMKDMARAANFSAKGTCVFWRKSGAKISDINQIINKYKYPVGVEWQGMFHEFEDEDNGHYSVVTKIDSKSGYMRIADSFHAFAGVDRRFEITFFTKRWWDVNQVKVVGHSKPRIIKDEKTMFVITPKGETWPKKLGMSK